MRLRLKSKAARYALVLCELIPVAALVVWISKTYIGGVVARGGRVTDFERASRLDPGNPEYHLHLASLLEYDVRSVDTAAAISHFRQAIKLSPYDAGAWLHLGVALELHGDAAEAEACLQRADSLGPRIPAVQWTIANNFLLRGGVDEAFRHFKIVLAGDAKYNRILFDRVWKASGDGDKILEEVIPDLAYVEIPYLYYLLQQKRYPEAQKIWKRIAASGQAFSAAQASPYIDSLIGARRWAEAYQVWNDLREKGLIKTTYEATGKNLLLNGDFEGDLIGIGFDWRVNSPENVSIGLDETTFHSPGHSLLIEFAGESNFDFRNVWEYVPVAPRHAYRLRGFMRTEGITTDSGPRLEVRDFYDPHNLDKFSEALTGTNGWTALTIDFTTGPSTELVVVVIVRRPSEKLDNKIAGKAWVDDLRLESSAGSSTAQRAKGATTE